MSNCMNNNLKSDVDIIHNKNISKGITTNQNWNLKTHKNTRRDDRQVKLYRFCTTFVLVGRVWECKVLPAMDSGYVVDMTSYQPHITCFAPYTINPPIPIYPISTRYYFISILYVYIKNYWQNIKDITFVLLHRMF